MSEQNVVIGEFVGKQGFEIQRCSGDVVVAFTEELEVLERPKGGKGKPVPTGRKEFMFDEFELAQRIELLRQLGHENSMEKWALGELRRCAIGMGIPPKGYPEMTVRDAQKTTAAVNSAEKKVEPRQTWMTDLLKAVGDRGRR